MFEKNNMKGSVIQFLVGASIGAIVALLFAPTSGKRLRKRIKNKSDEYYEDLEEIVTDTKIKAKDLINEGKKKSEEIVSSAKFKSEELLKKAEGLFKGN
jgi:gas vesicle protein